MRCLVLIAMVALIAAPATADAAFSAPQQVAAAGAYHRGFVAAADAAGRLNVATRAAFDTPRLVERAPGGAWADLPPVRGIAPRSFVYRTAISAAGNGALAVAWIIHERRTASVRVAVRDPGGALPDPVQIAGAEAAGVDNVATAIDGSGDVLLAYNTGTRASHLGMQGQIAVAYRPAGRSSFVGPTVVDRLLGNPPVVALAQDGTGIVTWTRRGALMAVTIGKGGAVGATKRIAPRVFVNRPVAAAGPRSAASIAYRVNDTKVRHGRITRTSSVRVFARPAGGSFGRAHRVFWSSGLGRDLALAADEQGRATLVWTDYPPFRQGRIPPGPVRIAAGRVGGRFGPSSAVGLREDDGLGPVAVSARNGRVALAWRGTVKGQGHVAAASGPWDAALTPQLIAADPGTGPPTVTLAEDGRASAFWRAGAIWVSDWA